MNTKQEVLEFAKSSASTAIDQAGEYGGLQNAIDAYRDNIRDTLNDEKLSCFEADAWAVYDAEVARLISKL